MKTAIVLQLSGAIACVEAGDLAAAEVHLDRARRMLGQHKLERGLVELAQAPVVETRELGFDLSDAQELPELVDIGGEG